MITCQICQHENPDGAEYCENCGAALAAATAPAVGAAAQVPPTTTPDSTPLSPMPAPAPLQPDAAATPAAESASPAAGVSAAQDSAAPAAPQDVSTGAVTNGAAPSATGQNPRLVARRYGATAADEYPLLGDHLVVGRFDPETGPVDIDLSQTPESVHISRHHAEIYREGDGRWYVKDLGATNGVFVKHAGSAAFGPRLTAPEPLAPGDEVAFGNARFVLETD
jgi:hypothetical protein